MAPERYIGLMSGTSLDGVDAALVEFSSDTQFRTISTLFTPFPEQLRQDLFRLFVPGDNEIDRMGEQCRKLGQLFADSVSRLIRQTDLNASDISAIGSHGQTIRHRPEESSPFTVQIGDPNTIAHFTGITTITDFRRRDIAAGGQGAPLAPAFHHAAFHDPEENRVILNIGGIANITWVPSTGECSGFDTGPGNGLMDTWCKKHTGNSYDDQGSWAKSGKVINDLLEDLFAFDYFDAAPPKSTGKELFNEDWLHPLLASHTDKKPEDIQATLLELTVISITNAIASHCPNADRIYVCGGGSLNRHLMDRIHQSTNLITESTQTLGIDPEWVEAIAFAWLARRTHQGLTGNLPNVTGAEQAVVLGAIYPGINGF